MNDSIILILAILISGSIGAFVGFTISKLKSKSHQSALQERLTQLQNSYEELKNTLDKLSLERDAIRQEKETLSVSQDSFQTE